MTAKTFEAGRRVRLRGFNQKGTIKQPYFFESQKKEGASIKWDDSRLVDTEHLLEELKLLKPRSKTEPMEAREWSLAATVSNTPYVLAGPQLSGIVYVIEKLPNTVQVSREDIAKAWDIQGNTPHEISILFKGFCKVLGFKEEA